MTKQQKDGLYFALSEAEYLADPALGASSICDLLISPAYYWANSNLNKNRAEEVDRDAQRFGTLVHKLLLEEPDMPLAVKPVGMSFATKDGKAWRADKQERGVDIVTNKEFSAIQAIQMAAKSAGLTDALEPCLPEVSYFWTDASGYRCKIRLDALGATQSFDLKTFANSMRKDLDVCIAHAVANSRYHIKAFWYRIGIDHMLKANAVGKLNVDDGEQSRKDLLAGLKQATEAKTYHPHWYAFLEKDGVPNCIMRTFRDKDHAGAMKNAYWTAAEHEVERATARYATCVDRYGLDAPWIETSHWKSFGDEEFGAARWILD